jgi:hypothetical protein
MMCADALTWLRRSARRVVPMQLSGVAAILRFPLPELEDQEL